MKTGCVVVAKMEACALFHSVPILLQSSCLALSSLPSPLVAEQLCWALARERETW